MNLGCPIGATAATPCRQGRHERFETSHLYVTNLNPTFSISSLCSVPELSEVCKTLHVDVLLDVNDYFIEIMSNQY